MKLWRCESGEAHEHFRRSVHGSTCRTEGASLTEKARSATKHNDAYTKFAGAQASSPANCASLSATARASIISPMSPIMKLSREYSDRPILWSVTLPCGKL